MHLLMKSFSSYIYYLRISFLVVWASVVLCVDKAYAGKLVIWIQAANKSDITKNVPIRANLPAKIEKADILDLGGLTLDYDVKSDTYYVSDTIQMPPHTKKDFKIAVRDIWNLDPKKLESYRDRAGVLCAKLSGSKFSAKCTSELDAIKTEADKIIALQKEKTITAVSPIEHIQAYEKNVRMLQDIKNRVGKIENMALAAGINPGKNLIGDDITASLPRRKALEPQEFGEAIMKVIAINNSNLDSSKNTVKAYLPPELSVDDVIDAGGLGVRYDPNKKAVYVFKDNVKIPAHDKVVYKVRIHDKWNINTERMKFIQEKANELLQDCTGKNGIEAVVNTLNDAVKKLHVLMKEKGPTELNPAYIAYYRRQSDKLDAIERTLNRVDAALKPQETKKGFPVVAPDRKTTWLIIYVILGFLALMSMLFFLRWFVKSS